jgi:hypothetical protein
VLSDFDKANIDQILSGHGDWFTAYLIRYIGGVDPESRRAVARGFPNEVAAVGDRRTTASVPSWHFLLTKADSYNRRLLDHCTAVQVGGGA